MKREEFHPLYQVEVDILQWFHTLEDCDVILTNEWRKVKETGPCVLIDTLRFPDDNSIQLFDC